MCKIEKEYTEIIKNTLANYKKDLIEIFNNLDWDNICEETRMLNLYITGTCNITMIFATAIGEEVCCECDCDEEHYTEMYILEELDTELYDNTFSDKFLEIPDEIRNTLVFEWLHESIMQSKFKDHELPIVAGYSDTEPLYDVRNAKFAETEEEYDFYLGAECC